MGMVALVALAFTSCKKNEETQKSSFYASGVAFNYENAEDRAYFDAHNFHFQRGDVCMVFNIDETTPTNSHAALYGAIEDGTQNVHFVNIDYGEVAEDMLDGYYAFYPGGPGHTITYLANGENKCKFYVAPEQEYRPNMVPNECLYAASKAEDGSHLMGDTYFTFYPIMGVLHLRPFEAAKRTVTKIEVVDNGFNLSGLVELIIPEVDMAEMRALFNQYDMNNPSYVARLEAYKTKVGYNVTGEDIYYPVTDETITYVKGNRMTLNVPGGVTLTDDKTTTPAFDIVLRPLALSQGFHLIFTFDNGDVKDCNLSHVSRLIRPNDVLDQAINLDNY